MDHGVHHLKGIPAPRQIFLLDSADNGAAGVPRSACSRPTRRTSHASPLHDHLRSSHRQNVRRGGLTTKLPPQVSPDISTRRITGCSGALNLDAATQRSHLVGVDLDAGLSDQDEVSAEALRLDLQRGLGDHRLGEVEPHVAANRKDLHPLRNHPAAGPLAMFPPMWSIRTIPWPAAGYRPAGQPPADRPSAWPDRCVCGRSAPPPGARQARPRSARRRPRRPAGSRPPGPGLRARRAARAGSPGQGLLPPRQAHHSWPHPPQSAAGPATPPRRCVFRRSSGPCPGPR